MGALSRLGYVWKGCRTEADPEVMTYKGRKIHRAKKQYKDAFFSNGNNVSFIIVVKTHHYSTPLPLARQERVEAAQVNHSTNPFRR
jgi:hypothetical protein